MIEKYDLRNLLVEEEEIKTPAVYNTSVYIFNIKFEEIQDDIPKIKEKTIELLKDKFYFRIPRKKKMREGFLDVKIEKDIIKCIYAKESPTKILYVTDDLNLMENRIKLINPNNMKASLEIFPERARLTLIGGKDNLITKTVGGIQFAMRSNLKGRYIDVSPILTQEDMRYILSKIENVQYLWIDPGDSDNFISMIKTVKKEEINYKVDAKFRGTRITMAPIVSDILDKERKIRIREIQGHLNFGSYQITTKIYSKGKMLFTIPDEIIPRGGLVQDIAEILYQRILKSYKE